MAGQAVDAMSRRVGRARALVAQRRAEKVGSAQVVRGALPVGPRGSRSGIRVLVSGIEGHTRMA